MIGSVPLHIVSLLFVHYASKSIIQPQRVLVMYIRICMLPASGKILFHGQ